MTQGGGGEASNQKNRIMFFCFFHDDRSCSFGRDQDISSWFQTRTKPYVARVHVLSGCSSVGVFGVCLSCDQNFFLRWYALCRSSWCLSVRPFLRRIPGFVDSTTKPNCFSSPASYRGCQITAMVDTAVENLNTFYIVGVVEQYRGFIGVLRRALDPEMKQTKLWRSALAVRDNG